MKNVNYPTFRRIFGLDSTAIGYDVVIIKSGVNGLYEGKKAKRYKNVTSSTMKRFYNVSDGRNLFRHDGSIHYRRFMRLFG